MASCGLGTEVLDHQVEAPSKAAESTGVTTWSMVGAQRYPGRFGRVLVAGVEAAEQVAVGDQLSHRATIGHLEPQGADQVCLNRVAP